MIKMETEESIYKPGSRRFWHKLKFLEEGQMESIDVLVMGGYRGKGKRQNFLGSILVGILNKQDQKYYPLSKIGTGFDEETLERLTNEIP